jgi:hypothetical protein
MTDLKTAFSAFLPKTDGERILTGQRGRPLTRCTLENIANDYQRNAPHNGARQLLESDPEAALRMLLAERRDLTGEEAEALAKTSDGYFQGLRDGEPVQVETRASFNVTPMENEDLASAMMATLPIAIEASKLMAQRSGNVIHLAFVRWAVARSARPGANGGKDGKLPKSLANLVAKYQGVIYATDSEAKEGFLSLATVYPSGRVEMVGRPQVPEETKAQRDARRKREKRAEAKATVNA